MPDPFKFQRALFPELEPRTIIALKAPDARMHRCIVIWADQATDEIRAKTRGLNSGLFVSMHESKDSRSGNLQWEENASVLSTWF
jgi:hypothetical protein